MTAKLFYRGLLKQSGVLHLWGPNDYIQSHPLVEDPETAEYWIDPHYPLISDVAQVSLAANHSGVVKTNGNLHLWGSNAGGICNPNDLSNWYWAGINEVILSGITQVSLSFLHTAVITTTGDLIMWGQNGANRLSNPLSSDAYWYDNEFSIMSGVKSVLRQGNRILVLKENGDLHAWGQNNYRQTNPASATNPWLDHTNVVLSGVKAVFGNSECTFAVKENGDLHAWGRNNNRLVNPASSDSVWTDTSNVVLAGVKEVVIGSNFVVVVMENGEARAWGHNGVGNVDPVGGPSNETLTDTENIITSGVEKLQIITGYSNQAVVFLDASQQFRGWGPNIDRVLNINTLQKTISDPSQVSMTGIADFEVGYRYIMFMDSNGSVFGYGMNGTDRTVAPWDRVTWYYTPDEITNAYTGSEYGVGGDNPFIFGLTTLDRDVLYQGVTYSAVNGFDPLVLTTDIGLGVDNSEGYALLAGEVPGLTAQAVKAGILDDAEWEMLLINYEDTSMGHVLLDAGDVGEIKIIDNTVFVPELLSYAMRLHQPIGDVWSVHCRAIFGTPPDSPKGCGKSTQGTWESYEVTGLGAEGKFNFIYGEAPPIPGRLKWTSGDNQSDRLYPIDSYDEGTGIATLIEGTPYAIAIGDTFDIRPDCDHTPAMCKSYGNWLNFKGEPLIPTTEGNDVLTPGVQI
jgi:uncharacterized phage protein (TIGR02218 family)